MLDLAVIGAGAAGTYVADAMQEARPEWSIRLFERTDRIGGRLRSVRVPGLDHRIELGGMRFLTSHRRMAEVVAAFAIPTHPFDPTGGADRSYLAGRFGAGFQDAGAGAGYDLPVGERGRSASDLATWAAERIAGPLAALDAAGWANLRATHIYVGRPLTDWSIADALGTVLSDAGRRFVTDSLGYDSGPRAFNVGDAIEYFFGGGDPSAEARTPDDGMDRIPRELASRFQARGGTVAFGHELQAVGVDDGEGIKLEFGDGVAVLARRVVITTAIPALRLLAAASPPLESRAFRTVLASVEGFQAAKLYTWYDRPWWRAETHAYRTITDLPSRKVFYFDEAPDGPAALLATYTDGDHTDVWRDLAAGVSNGAPAPAAVQAAVDRYLAILHPSVSSIPEPVGSAFMHWGSDQHETGWTFWRPGVVSDDVMAAAPQPEPDLPIYLAGESFSRAQAWAEGALETAAEVVSRIGSQLT